MQQDIPGFPPGEWLDTGDSHRVWWACGGDPQGLPVLMVHGGPGGRSRPEALAWWRGLPVRWIAIDQRGCGRSEPAGRTEENTLSHLLDDMERVRVQLGLPRWSIAAGSWGSLVALAYLVRHPERVEGMFLRSSFLGSAGELARYLDAWPRWLGEPGREALGDDAERLVSLLQTATVPRHAGTAAEQGGHAWRNEVRTAAAWEGYDDAQSVPGGVDRTGARWAPGAGRSASAEVGSDPAPTPVSAAAAGSVSAGWRVFMHYAAAGWGLGREGLLQRLQRDVAPPPGPCTLVHGLDDACCDPATSEALAAWHGQAALRRVAGGGHRQTQPEMASALAEAAREWVLRHPR